MILAFKKPDGLGALASTLCMLHCLATPFLFIAQAGSAHCCDEAPVWWRTLDFLFLVISFVAIYRSTQTTTSGLIKPGLWISWLVLSFIIINEKIGWFHLPELLTYLSAATLVILHLYNLNYCQCETEDCCAKNG